MKLIFADAAESHYGPIFAQNRELLPVLDCAGNLYYKISDIEALIYDISGVKDTKNNDDSLLSLKGFLKKTVVLKELGVSDSRYYKWIREDLIPAPARNGYITKEVVKRMLELRDGLDDVAAVRNFIESEDLPDFAK